MSKIEKIAGNDNSIASNTEKKQVVGSDICSTATKTEIEQESAEMAATPEVKISDTAESLPEPANDNSCEGGPKTPGDGALALPQQEELYINIEEVVNKFNLPKAQLEQICANDPKAVYIPTDTLELQKFIQVQKGMSLTAKNFSKLNKLPKETRKFFLQKAQLFGYIWLKSEAQLGKKIQEIATKSGTRTDLKNKKKVSKKEDKSKKGGTTSEESETVSKKKRPFKEVFEEIRTKKEILDQDYNLSYSQARDLVRLNDDLIEREIKYAIANNENPSRRHALSFLNKGTSKDEKECDDKFELNTVFCSVGHDALMGRITEEDIPYCSIFSCIGSGEYYLKSRGFKCVLANEASPSRADYFSLKMKELGEDDCLMLQGRFQDRFDELVDEFKKRKCQLLLVSPPCQIFCSQKGKNFLKDPRLDLIVWVIKFIKAVKLKYIVIENARQFLNFSMPKDTTKDGEPAKNLRAALNGRTIGQYIKDELEDEKFAVNFADEDACFYGCAQSRVRSIVLASKTGTWPFPKPDDYATLPWQVIGHLPSLEPGKGTGYDEAPVLSNDPDQAREIYEALIHTPTGCCTADNPPEYQIAGYGYFGAKCARNSWNNPWSTVEGGADKALGLRTIHPGRRRPDGTYSDPRCCTLRETFLINSLPEDYTIPAKYDTPEYRNFIWTVMGEIFLPRMLERIMETIPLPHRKDKLGLKEEEEAA